jgi:hypothetical protein
VLFLPFADHRGITVHDNPRWLAETPISRPEDILSDQPDGA